MKLHDVIKYNDVISAANSYESVNSVYSAENIVVEYVEVGNFWDGPCILYYKHTTKKILGAKNMQNLAQFRTTSKFGGEYLRNG